MRPDLNCGFVAICWSHTGITNVKERKQAGSLDSCWLPPLTIADLLGSVGVTQASQKSRKGSSCLLLVTSTYNYGSVRICWCHTGITKVKERKQLHLAGYLHLQLWICWDLLESHRHHKSQGKETGRQTGFLLVASTYNCGFVEICWSHTGITKVKERKQLPLAGYLHLQLRICWDLLVSHRHHKSPGKETGSQTGLLLGYLHLQLRICWSHTSITKVKERKQAGSLDSCWLPPLTITDLLGSVGVKQASQNSH
jgi:hypothetical protein